VGEAARNVLKEGQAMLDRIVKGRWLTGSGVYGLWPANSAGDDIEIYADEKRERVLMTWHNLRQQNEKPAAIPTSASPISSRRRTRRSGLRRRLRGHRGPRHRCEGEGVRGEARRLQRDHGEGARRSPRGGLRRAPALPRAHRVLGYAADENSPTTS
jgi:hypothetical protein